MDLGAITGAWPALAVTQLKPLTTGANNTVYLVDGSADQYVLRIYRNHADIPRLDVEHSILRALQQAKLPFAIPVPIAAADGHYCIQISDTERGNALAELFPFLPGSQPNRHDTTAAHAAGEALGMLHLALEGVTLPGAPMLAPLGDFSRRFPTLGDPAATLATLNADGESVRRILALYQQLNERLPALYASLPCQMIHGDYDTSNILMADAHVTAILDFEFSTLDLRALDLAFALSWWPVDLLGTGREWPIIDALGMGYTSQITLTDGEIAALPALLQLRSFGSLLHRMARYRQGLDRADFLVRRIEQTTWREDWLAANRETLLRLASGWRR